MVTTELLPDKVFTLDSFIEIVEAVDDKIHKSDPEKIEKLRKIQGALYEILSRAHEYETYKKEDLIFPYETLISIEVTPNQIPRYTWTDEMLSRLV